MHLLLRRCAIAVAIAVHVVPARAAAQGTWHPEVLGRSLASVALFGLTGVLVAIIGYKLFDAATPGDLHKEILEHRNTAAAIVAAAVILGVSLIVAASIVG